MTDTCDASRIRRNSREQPSVGEAQRGCECSTKERRKHDAETPRSVKEIWGIDKMREVGDWTVYVLGASATVRYSIAMPYIMPRSGYSEYGGAKLGVNMAGAVGRWCGGIKRKTAIRYSLQQIYRTTNQRNKKAKKVGKCYTRSGPASDRKHRCNEWYDIMLK